MLPYLYSAGTRSLHNGSNPDWNWICEISFGYFIIIVCCLPSLFQILVGIVLLLSSEELYLRSYLHLILSQIRTPFLIYFLESFVESFSNYVGT